MSDKYLNLDQLCERIHFKKQSVYNLLHLEKIPYKKLGSKVLFDPEAIDLWVDEQTEQQKKLKQLRRSARQGKRMKV